MKDGEVASYGAAIMKLEEEVDDLKGKVLTLSLASSRLESARRAARSLPSGDDMHWCGVPLTEFTDDELRRIASRSLGKGWRHYYE